MGSQESCSATHSHGWFSQSFTASSTFRVGTPRLGPRNPSEGSERQRAGRRELIVFLQRIRRKASSSISTCEADPVGTAQARKESWRPCIRTTKTEPNSARRCSTKDPKRSSVGVRNIPDAIRRFNRVYSVDAESRLGEVDERSGHPVIQVHIDDQRMRHQASRLLMGALC